MLQVVHPLATVSISDMLAEYCDFNPSMIFAGYFLMVLLDTFSFVFAEYFFFKNIFLWFNWNANL